jgi:hypothetical protein
MFVFLSYLSDEVFDIINILILSYRMEDNITVLNVEYNIPSYGKSYLFCDYRRYANPEAISPFCDCCRHGWIILGYTM